MNDASYGMFVAMMGHLDCRSEAEAELAIALLVAQFMHSTQGMATLWSVADTASNIYLSPEAHELCVLFDNPGTVH